MTGLSHTELTDRLREFARAVYRHDLSHLSPHEIFAARNVAAVVMRACEPDIPMATGGRITLRALLIKTSRLNSGLNVIDD